MSGGSRGPADETLEQEIDTVGIDVGDAEADSRRRSWRPSRGPGRGCPRSRVADEVVDGEEVRLVVELRDQRQFVLDAQAHLGRQALRVATRGAIIGEMHERILRAGEAVDGLIGIFVAQFIERKGERVAQAQRFLDRLRRVAEQPFHFFRGLEMAFGIDRQLSPGAVDGGFLADAGEHVGERAAIGMVIEHVVDRDQRDVRRMREFGKTLSRARSRPR